MNIWTIVLIMLVLLTLAVIAFLMYEGKKFPKYLKNMIETNLTLTKYNDYLSKDMEVMQKRTTNERIVLLSDEYFKFCLTRYKNLIKSLEESKILFTKQVWIGAKVIQSKKIDVKKELEYTLNYREKMVDSIKLYKEMISLNINNLNNLIVFGDINEENNKIHISLKEYVPMKISYENNNDVSIIKQLTLFEKVHDNNDGRRKILLSDLGL